jgi:hypothetical protein
MRGRRKVAGDPCARPRPEALLSCRTDTINDRSQPLKNHTQAHSFQHTIRQHAFRTGLYVSPSFVPSLCSCADQAHQRVPTPFTTRSPRRRSSRRMTRTRPSSSRQQQVCCVATGCGYKKPRPGADGLRQTRRLARSWPRRLAARAL